MKKKEFFAVYTKGEVEPCAVFMFEKDAVSYDYVRFGGPGDGKVSTHEVLSVMLPANKTYASLAFKEGLAFNKVMKYRQSLYRGCV